MVGRWVITTVIFTQIWNSVKKKKFSISELFQILSTVIAFWIWGLSLKIRYCLCTCFLWLLNNHSDLKENIFISWVLIICLLWSPVLFQLYTCSVDPASVGSTFDIDISELPSEPYWVFFEGAIFMNTMGDQQQKCHDGPRIPAQILCVGTFAFLSLIHCS
jgi:hypothetical protein